MFLEKIEDRSAVVGILGLGYVGLPLAAAFVDAGFPVLGFDTDPSKIEMLAKGENYLKHLGDSMTQKLQASGRFEATANFTRLGEADAVLLCVPTPLGEHNEPDLSYVEHSTKQAAATLRKGQLVVLESTTYPGTTREPHGGHPREDGTRAPARTSCSPTARSAKTRAAPESRPTRFPSSSAALRPVGEGGLRALQGRDRRRCIRSRRRRSPSPPSCSRTSSARVNIALVNELKVILDAMDIDVWEVIDAAATKPFGFMPFYPGPGLGGHCIPIDPFYLTWRREEDGTPHALHRAGR